MCTLAHSCELRAHQENYNLKTRLGCRKKKNDLWNFWKLVVADRGQRKYRMGFLVFTFSLHHCFLAGMQYNPNLGNDFHFGEKWSKVSILVLTLGMGTCPPQETPLLPFVCLFVVYFFVLTYISFQAVLWSRNNNSSHWNKNCEEKKTHSQLRAAVA